MTIRFFLSFESFVNKNLFKNKITQYLIPILMEYCTGISNEDKNGMSWRKDVDVVELEEKQPGCSDHVNTWPTWLDKTV